MAEEKSVAKDTKAHKDAVLDVPKPVSSLDLETSARSKRFLKASVGPAVMGLVSAALLVGVIALYTWGSTVSSESSNASNVAIGWSGVLPVAAIILGLVVGIGLPVLWAYKKGFAHVVMVIAFEGAALLLALLISGFFLFGASTNTGPGPTPVGCGCGLHVDNAAQVCEYCAN